MKISNGVVLQYDEKLTKTGKDIYFLKVEWGDGNVVDLSGFGKVGVKEGDCVDVEYVEKGQYKNVVDKSLKIVGKAKENEVSDVVEEWINEPKKDMDSVNRYKAESEDKFAFGMAVNNVLGKLDDKEVDASYDKGLVIDKIKYYFEVIKEARKELLGY